MNSAAIAAVVIALLAAPGHNEEKGKRVPSPDEIIRMVEAVSSSGSTDLSAVWNALHVNPKTRVPSDHGFDQGSEKQVCWMGCKADVVAGQELSLQPGSGTLMRICMRGDRECRFLLLGKTTDGWFLSDYVDSIFTKYDKPEARVIVSSTRQWLAILDFSSGGTGVYAQSSSWYEIRDGRLKRILEVTNTGHDVNDNPERFFSSRFLGYQAGPGKDVLRFVFSVEFKTHGEGELLWNDECAVTYSRASGMGVFRFDRAESALDEKAADGLFNYDSLKTTTFVRIASSHLMEIARNRQDPRRQWLKDFLKENDSLRQLDAVRTAFRAAGND
jgi:hypothetical protein